MATESKSQLQITDAYRSAKRDTSVLCAIGLAWSAAQFELKSLNLGPAGSVDLSTASIPLILACGIAYTMARYTIEYAMQPDEVRRWRLAQADFKLSVFLVRATLVMLAAGGLNRSVETLAYVALAALILLGGSALLLFLGTLAVMPLLIFIRARQGRHSVASRAIEATAWAELIVVVVLVALLVALGVASLRYEPLRALWTVSPSPVAVGVFVAAIVGVVISLYLQRAWYAKLFASPPPFSTTKLPDGRSAITFGEQERGVQQSHPHKSQTGLSNAASGS